MTFNSSFYLTQTYKCQSCFYLRSAADAGRILDENYSPFIKNDIKAIATVPRRKETKENKEKMVVSLKSQNTQATSSLSIQVVQ